MTLTINSPRKALAWNWIKKNTTGLVFILPALVMYGIFFIIPFITSIYYSLTSWNGYDPVKEFVGLQNYARLLNDPMIWASFSHNLIWIAIGSFAPIMIALPLAYLMSNIKRGRLIFQTAFFMPYILSGVLIGVIWGWIYNPVFGILNYLLNMVGLGFLSRGWLGDPNLALYAVLVAAIWGYFGFCVVILMAGLQNINIDLIDAAKIDGANSSQVFLSVVIPQLRNIINMLIVLNLIGGFNVFDLIKIMTSGGPANHTEVIATYNFDISFQQFNIGYGAAISLIMTVLSLVISYFYISMRERQEVGE